MKVVKRVMPVHPCDLVAILIDEASHRIKMWLAVRALKIGIFDDDDRRAWITPDVIIRANIPRRVHGRRRRKEDTLVKKRTVRTACLTGYEDTDNSAEADKADRKQSSLPYE